MEKETINYRIKKLLYYLKINIFKYSIFYYLFIISTLTNINL